MGPEPSRQKSQAVQRRDPAHLATLLGHPFARRRGRPAHHQRAAWPFAHRDHHGLFAHCPGTQVAATQSARYPVSQERRGLLRPRHELAQVVDRFAEALHQDKPLPAWHRRTLRAISQCRTQALGGHLDACTDCGHLRLSYNSCRNRHCPKCQNTARERWALLRAAELPPVGCFHLVFTLPSQLQPLCRAYPKALYDMLLAAAWQTIQALACDPDFLGAQTGMIAVLHTWGQQLMLHPHLHCVVPAGGLTLRNRWKGARASGKFLSPGKAVSAEFRARFMALISAWNKKTGTALDPALRKALFDKPWVVYAKQPLPGTACIIEYLARYTHKTAISNHRLIAVDEQTVTLRYKDYRLDGGPAEMTLDGTEFLRRFCLHILPRGFRRIRHYGILSNRNKANLLGQAPATSQAIKAMDWKALCTEALGFHPDRCPQCGNHTLITVQTLMPKRGPPDGSLSIYPSNFLLSHSLMQPVAYHNYNSMARPNSPSSSSTSPKAS